MLRYPCHVRPPSTQRRFASGPLVEPIMNQQTLDQKHISQNSLLTAASHVYLTQTPHKY